MMIDGIPAPGPSILTKKDIIDEGQLQPATVQPLSKMHGLENARYRCSLFIGFADQTGPCRFLHFSVFFFSLLYQSFHVELMAIHFQQRYHVPWRLVLESSRSKKQADGPNRFVVANGILLIVLPEKK